MTGQTRLRRETQLGVAELHCHTNFSLLEGASHPEDLALRAAELGLAAVAVTDHNGLYGAPRFAQAAREAGLPAIVGAEVEVTATPAGAPPDLRWRSSRTSEASSDAGRGTRDARRHRSAVTSGLTSPHPWGCSSKKHFSPHLETKFGHHPHSPTLPLSRSPALHLTLLVEDAAGYANLCRLLSQGQLAGSKGKPQITLEDLAANAGGLVCLSGCRQGPLASALLRGQRAAALSWGEWLWALFGPGRFWVEAQNHRQPQDLRLVAELAELAERLRVGLVATNTVLYAEPSDRPLQDVLTCIKHRTTLEAAAADGLLRPNAEFGLKSASEMAELFQRYPHALANTLRVAERCAFRLENIGYRFPSFPVPDGETPFSYLYGLCHAGARERYGPMSPEVSRQLAHELELIQKLGLAEYFLIVWDIMRFARERGILAQGRGSAANSVVAYVLGITNVDPIKLDLLFERFLSEERPEAPDIDVDFANKDREQVIQYVYERYGRDHAGMVCEVITYRPRSAIRDVGKALGLSLEQVDRLAKAVDHYSLDDLQTALEAHSAGIPSHEGIPCHSAPPPCHPERSEESAPPGVLILRSAQDDSPQQTAAPPQPSPADHGARRAGACPPPSFDADGHELLLRHEAPMKRRRADNPRPRSPHPPPRSGVSALRSPTTFQNLSESDRQPSEDVRSRTVAPSLLPLVRAIQHFPRHLGIHVGGMIVTKEPLGEVVPLERATMAERTVVQWDKDDVEAMGLVKIDLLGLGMLSLLQDALKLVEQHRGVTIDLARLGYDDPKVYDMLCRADAVGLFQVESRAQMNCLPRLKPRTFYDLVIEISLIRPGPIQGGSVHPYLRRRAGKEPVTYPHPVLEPVLKKTLGVPLFQEQGMRLAVAAAGFSPGKADQLRRAMGHKRSRERMAELYDELVCGMAANGIPEDVGQQVWKQLSAFADYGFPESHAASFALLVYASAYLKLYYPAEFYCAILNNQPMGFYPPAVLVGDARRHGVAVLPVDVNRSQADCTVEGVLGVGYWVLEDEGLSLTPNTRDPTPAVRLGFKYVKGLGETACARLDAVGAPVANGRTAVRPYEDLRDFCGRTGLDRRSIERLIAVGAFDSLGRPRRELLWELPAILEELRAGELPGLAAGTEAATFEPPDAIEETNLDYSLLGLSTSRHAMEFYRPTLAARGVRTADELPDLPHGRVIAVAGLVICRQAPPTAGGHVFLTLEDETGLANVIVRPQVYQRQRAVVRAHPAIVAEGVLQNQEGAISLLARRFTALGREHLAGTVPSRDFH